MASPHQPDLSPDEHDGWGLQPEIDTLYEVRGSYNPMQFVVHLHPDIQQTLASVRKGVYRNGGITGDVVLAFSTSFHETIHWWQHIGSTLGLMLSLSYPAQSHVNHEHLRTIVEGIGPTKSLRTLQLSGRTVPHRIEFLLNIVLNNFHDIEYCRRIALNPKAAPTITRDRYFEALGHGYHITWSSVIDRISALADPMFHSLPDIRRWPSAFLDLRDRRVEGYYHPSRTVLMRCGALDIFEAQARFSQLHYLHFGSGRTLTWEHFDYMGMLTPRYTDAFNAFLDTFEEQWPESPDHPIVALFLLICDMAMNPAEGFPFDISSFDTFVEDVDPGIRFFRLSAAARDNKTETLQALTRGGYTRDAYLDASHVLAQALDWPDPIEICRTVTTWPAESAGFAELAAQDATFRFPENDLPIRLFIARFVAFQRDKLANPQFFVWPGVHAALPDGSGLTDDELLRLYGEHEPLFIRVPKGSVQPAVIAGRATDDINQMFTTFYVWNLYYNLVWQWHVQDGPFVFDFTWLLPNWSAEGMERWASAILSQAFGCLPGDFETL
jgi:hypothetical protein